jgi:hypothetical protein
LVHLVRFNGSQYTAIETITPWLRVQLFVSQASPREKLAGDLGNVFEATRNGDRRSDRLLAGKLSSGNIGLLQRNLPTADAVRRSK